MPTYGYRCTVCGHEFERVQKMTDASIKECENCGQSVKKVLYPVGISFKGSGFYVTDYKGAGKEESTGATKADGSGGEASAKTDSDSAPKSDGAAAPATSGADAGGGTAAPAKTESAAPAASTSTSPQAD